MQGSPTSASQLPKEKRSRTTMRCTGVNAKEVSQPLQRETGRNEDTMLIADSQQINSCKKLELFDKLRQRTWHCNHSPAVAETSATAQITLCNACESIILAQTKITERRTSVIRIDNDLQSNHI